ncbi:hypothetical protein ACRAWD_10295 [Caulobacter segnis]
MGLAGSSSWALTRPARPTPAWAARRPIRPIRRRQSRRRHRPRRAASRSHRRRRGPLPTAPSRAQRDKAMRAPWTPMACARGGRTLPVQPLRREPAGDGARDARSGPGLSGSTRWPRSTLGARPGSGPAESGRTMGALAEWRRPTLNAWIKTAPNAATIGTVTAGERMISWPYPKLMVANPQVNQAAAILVVSLALARELGVP